MTTKKFDEFILADSKDGAVLVGLDENGLNARFPASVFAGNIPPNLIFGGTVVSGPAIQTIPVGVWTEVYWEGWPGSQGSTWELQEDRIRIKCPAGQLASSGVFQIYSGVAWDNTDPALVGVHRRRVRLMQEVDGVITAGAWGTNDFLFFPGAGDDTQNSYTEIIVNMMFPWSEIQEHDAYVWMEVWHNAEVPIDLVGYAFDAPLWMSSYISEFQSRTITPPDPPIEVAAELVYLSTTAFDGYRSTFGMVNTDPTGDYLLFSHTGYGRVMVSDDAGVTFAESSSFGGGAGNTSNWRVLDFRWDAFNSRFQGHIRRVDTRASYWSTLEPAVTTWVAQTNQGGYNRSYHITDTGSFYQGSGSDLKVYSGLPFTSDLEFTSGSRTSRQTLSLLKATDDLLFLGYAKEDNTDRYYVRVIPRSFVDEGTYYGAVFGDTAKVASRGEGVVLGYRSTSGSVVTLDKLDVTSGVIQITIDFGTNLSFADICYSPELDGYMVIAIDADDNRLAHIRYNVGDETATWIATDSVYLNGYVESDSRRQIVHAVGDVYYYAYLQAYGTLNVSTLERITLNDTPPNPNIIETVFIHNYETYGAGVYTATVGDDLNAASLPQNATAKYGSWAMGYTGLNRGQIDADVDIDPNNFTMELYYNAQSLASHAGLFFYGTTGQDAIRLQGVVRDTGAISLFCTTGTIMYNLTTAAGLITTGSYNEICFEADRAGQMAYIYLNGVVVGSTAMVRTVWNGSLDFYMAYARLSSNNLYSQGYIDSTRLSKGARYGGAGYTPHVGPFTS